jgi:hypothetical protein
MIEFSHDDTLFAIKLGTSLALLIDNHPNLLFLYSTRQLTLQSLLILPSSSSIDFAFIPQTNILCIVYGSSTVVFLDEGKIF